MKNTLVFFALIALLAGLIVLANKKLITPLEAEVLIVVTVISGGLYLSNSFGRAEA